MGMTIFGMRMRGVEDDSDDYELPPGPGRLVRGIQSLHYQCNGCCVSRNGRLAEHATRHEKVESVDVM